MDTLRVRVKNGQIVGAAPEGLAEGTELELCIAEPEEKLSEAELAELNEALEAGWRELQAGAGRPAADVIADLRKQG